MMPPLCLAHPRFAVVRTLNALAVRHPGETVLCVSHGGPLEATVRALDPTVGHFHANYTCLAVFVETPTSATGWACLEKPDNSHVA